MAEKGLFDEALSRVGLDLTRAANLLRQLSNFYLLDVRTLDVVIPAGEVFVYQPHGLGRPAQGAICIGQSDNQALVTVGMPGYDHARVFVSINSASTRDVRIKLLVI